MNNETPRDGKGRGRRRHRRRRGGPARGAGDRPGDNPQGTQRPSAERGAVGTSTATRPRRPAPRRSGPGRGGSGRGDRYARREQGGTRQPRSRDEGVRERLDQALRRLQGLISVDPQERLRLETTAEHLTMRVVEIVAPIGKGQRCLVVSPPKAGKTTLLLEIAQAVAKNHPQVVIRTLLVDERPEEVTSFRRSAPGEVFAASSDLTAKEHIDVAEKCFLDAIEQVLEGRDVLLVLDSITRLARAFNTQVEGIGRTLSGGLDAATMQMPRRLFGAGRNIEDGGSLTLIGTALIETGSRMDQVIFEEFKGTGNTEIVLSREIFQKRVFPCIDVAKTGTRKEELLYSKDEIQRVQLLRRALLRMDRVLAMEKLLDLLRRYPTNQQALAAVGSAIETE
jgi:transcription termination factor Rho